MSLEDKADCCYQENKLELLSVSTMSSPHLLQRQVVTTNVVSASAADHASLDTQVESSVSKRKTVNLVYAFEDEDSDGGIFTAVTQYLSSNEKPCDEDVDLDGGVNTTVAQYLFSNEKPCDEERSDP